MGSRKRIEGNRYGRLIVTEYRGLDVSRKRSLYLCVCDCGNEVVTRSESLRKGLTKSCGCFNLEVQKAFQKENTIHGLSKSRILSIWTHMRARCLNPNETGYSNYGGRGISICERWMDFNNFVSDMQGNYFKHEKTHGTRDTLLDRIDNDGNYEPNNCRWATQKIQSNNTRKQKEFVATNVYTGELHFHNSQTLIAEKLGICSSHINQVLKGKRKTVSGYKFQYMEESV